MVAGGGKGVFERKELTQSETRRVEHGNHI